MILVFHCFWIALDFLFATLIPLNKHRMQDMNFKYLLKVRTIMEGQRKAKKKKFLFNLN